MSSDGPRGFREQRLDPRASIMLAVRIQVDAFEEQRTGLTANVSISGLFMTTSRPEPVGSLIKFELDLYESGPTIRGVGEVVWIRVAYDGPSAPVGMGIRFGHLKQRELLALRARLREELGSEFPDESS